MKLLAPVPIFEASIESFMENLCVLFGRKIPVVLTYSDNSRVKLSQDQGKPTFPYFAVRIASVEIGSPHYNPFVMKKVGVLTNRNSDSTQGFTYNMKPVKVTLECKFYCENDKDLFNFISQWLFNEHKIHFELTDASGHMNIMIRSTLEKSISIPTKTNDEVGEYFLYQGTANMDTFIGEVNQVPLVVEWHSSITEQNTLVTPPTNNVLATAEKRYSADYKVS